MCGLPVNALLSHMYATGIYIRGSIHFQKILDGGLRLMLHAYTYGVALVSSINKIIGLFCKRAL